ncbi:hypothetical protein ACS15_5539 [Ralstonia insidiosa]|uniref:Uncharacterized protein n=1 Tax=Ralstonia insidiosa TaxID=190721 RepID=A0AAC9FV66_9RALS|nr:hypothetical protein ACS15_5539 [Ralstonia insidiosa]
MKTWGDEAGKSLHGGVRFRRSILVGSTMRYSLPTGNNVLAMVGTAR